MWDNGKYYTRKEEIIKHYKTPKRVQEMNRRKEKKLKEKLNEK